MRIGGMLIPRFRMTPVPKGQHLLRPNKFFYKGNQFSTKHNMPDEANTRRIKGLLKAWDYKVRQRNGEKFMTVRKKKRKRARLIITVAKEAREIQNIARTHASEAMQRLAEIVNNRQSMDSVAIAAAAVIFDRAYGKASQTNINANVDTNDKPSEITGKELDNRIAQALKRVEELAGRTPKAPPREKRPIDLRELDRDPDGTTQH